MKRSSRDLVLYRCHVVSLDFLGTQIFDLQISGYLSHHSEERIFGSVWSKNEVGIDFGIKWCTILLNGEIWIYHVGISLFGRLIIRSVWIGLSINLPAKEDGVLLSLLPLQRFSRSAEIALAPHLETKRMLWDARPESSIPSFDLNGNYARCINYSSLSQFFWRNRKDLDPIMGIDTYFNYRGFRSLIDLFKWYLQVYKEWARATIQSRSLLHLLVSLLSLFSWVFLSDSIGIFFLSFVSGLLCVKMSQGSLLGKDCVEKSLGAVVSKMRIKIPKFDNSVLIKAYTKTMIGRCMNPRKQDMKGLLLMFPRICQIEGRVAGADLGLGRFLLDFDEEKDIAEVLMMEPFHFDGWMVSLVRWKPFVDPTYPSSLTFWIRVLGIPIEYWAAPTFNAIGDALGKVVEVDVDVGRVQVVVDGFKPLCFETTIEFDSGEETLISLRY